MEFREYFLSLIYPRNVIIFTNGYHSPEARRFLLKNKQIKNLIITVDGTKPVHNTRRISQVYSYEELIRNILLYNDNDIRTTLQINIDEGNKDCLISFLRELDISTLEHKKLHVNINKVLHSTSTISNLEFLKCYINVREDFFPSNLYMTISSPMVRKVKSFLFNEGIQYERCAIEKTLVLDFVTRSAYACPQCSETCIGSFSYDELCLLDGVCSLFVEYSSKHVSQCLKCLYKKVCSYGCYIDKDISGDVCVESSKKELQYVLDNLDKLIDVPLC